MRIGVIGLGNIGGAITANLIEDGHEVFIFDTDKGRCEPLAGAGATQVSGPAEVAQRSDVTFTSLPSPGVMREVAEEWLDAATPDSVLIDLSTNAPQTVREVDARLASAGCHLLEAPLTGGAGNFFTDRMVEGINERGRPTQFSLALAAKDAGLLLDLAREAAVPMPVAAEIAQVFVAALGAGLGERDWSDLVELIERQADVKLELPPPRSSGGEKEKP
jgi:3-hydroxyisobutyrate dehydrogenase-like beta-hydroxyacid dehydrogenase